MLSVDQVEISRAKESNNNHQSGPLAWNLHTTNILRRVKQGIRCAQKIINALSLEKFDNNIKSLVKALKGNFPAEKANTQFLQIYSEF